MDSDKVGDLYFQKAESTRVTQRAFEGGGILGIIFTMATLIISADDTATDLSVLVGFLLIAVIVLFYARFYYDMTYAEYRTDYISYYAVKFVDVYVNEVFSGQPVAEIGRSDVETIVRRMCVDLGFDESSAGQGVRACLVRMQNRTVDPDSSGSDAGMC